MLSDQDDLRTMPRAELEELRRRTLQEITRRNKEGEPSPAEIRAAKLATSYVVDARAHPLPSDVVESRAYEDGWLQLEHRFYVDKHGHRNPRGPYWYFRYHEGGKQKKLYLGKTDDPEGKLAEKRGLPVPRPVAEEKRSAKARRLGGR